MDDPKEDTYLPWFRIPRRSGDGQGIGAGAPHRGQLGRFDLENLPIVLWEDRRAMPRQRTDHSRIVYVFADDFPQRLVRFGEVSRMPWAEIARRLGAGPRPSGGGTSTAYSPTPTISWSYRTWPRATGSDTCSPSERRHTRQRSRRVERSPDKAPQIAPPGANRTPDRLDIPLEEGLRLPPGRTSDAMPRQRAHHNIGEATMSPGRCKASSHIWAHGESPRAVRSNLPSTRRRGSDGGSPIASLPELSGSLMERSRGSE